MMTRELEARKSLPYDELLRWVAELDCEISPNVCGTCIACRARQVSPDYERCAGSGQLRAGAGGPLPLGEPVRRLFVLQRICPTCDAVLGGTSEDFHPDERFPEHWKLRDDADEGITP